MSNLDVEPRCRTSMSNLDVEPRRRTSPPLLLLPPALLLVALHVFVVGPLRRGWRFGRAVGELLVRDRGQRRRVERGRAEGARRVLRRPAASLRPCLAKRGAGSRRVPPM